MRIEAPFAMGIGLVAMACSSGASRSTGAGGATGAGGSGAVGEDASVADVSTPVPAFRYQIGADITWVPHDEYYGATYVDTDGVQKEILALLKNHGFNSVRLRTFVDPKATDGYDQLDGFGDLRHTLSMGRRIKQAGMGFLLAMHYSDNWADPGKQCVPVAWQQDTFDQLVQHVHDYTVEVISTLKDGGAGPDLVQVGNEITSGMLIHVCDPQGIPTSINPVNGLTDNWTNLATLLKAGIRAVREVDPGIKVVLHIDRGGDEGGSVSWIGNALAQGVAFDVLADSTYVRWHGQPSGWQNTFSTLVSTFPTLSFIIPEYGNEAATSPATPSTMRIANDIIFNMPAYRGLGTWIYEPEHPNQAGVGTGLFASVPTDAGTVSDDWPTFTALPEAMAVYDQMKTDYASRL